MKINIKSVVIGIVLGTLFSSVVFASVGLLGTKVADDTKLIVLGKEVKTDIIYTIKEDEPNGNGKNYVSARDLAEALGYYVTWDGDNKVIEIKKQPVEEDTTLYSSDGLPVIVIDGVKYVTYSNVAKKLLEKKLSLSAHDNVTRLILENKATNEILVDNVPFIIYDSRTRIPLDFYESTLKPYTL